MGALRKTIGARPQSSVSLSLSRMRVRKHKRLNPPADDIVGASNSSSTSSGSVGSSTAYAAAAAAGARGAAASARLVGGISRRRNGAVNTRTVVGPSVVVVFDVFLDVEIRGDQRGWGCEQQTLAAGKNKTTEPPRQLRLRRPRRRKTRARRTSTRTPFARRVSPV